MSKSIKKGIFLVFKIAVSSALLAFLLSKVGGMAVIENAVLISPGRFAAAVGLYLFATFLSSLRWKLLIPQTIATRQLFSMYIIGSFFNICLPGIIGGDAVKAFYLSRELKRQKSLPDTTQMGTSSIAIASVFMDRYIGLAALLLIGLAALPAGFGLLGKTRVVWALPVMFAGFIIASVVLFKFRFGGRLKYLAGLYECFNYYFTKRRILLKCFTYSVAIQFTGMIAVYILAGGMALDISFLSILVFLPIIILITMIPVSISGLGIREGAFVFLLGTMGILPDRAMTLSILWFLSTVIAGLWGIVEYLRFKHMFGGGIKEESL